jgi:hypothetical protein
MVNNGTTVTEQRKIVVYFIGYVDDFHTNCQEMTTRTRRIRQNNLINNYYY